MNPDEARTFVRENHHAVLCTRRRDGRPQLSPVAAAVDDAGRIVISTRETALKVANLRRDSAVSLCVLADGFYGPWAQIDGHAELVSLPDALEPLVDYYRSVSGEHPDWDEYRTAMQQERRLVVRVTIEHAGPNRSG